VKFNFFHLAPYPYLPDDWEEHHETMSLDFPSGNFDPEVGHGLYHRYLDELEYAESVVPPEAWTVEHEYAIR